MALPRKPNSTKTSGASTSLLPRQYAHQEIVEELAQRNLRDFIRLAWPIVEPAKALINNWHIDAIADHLQAVTLRQIKHLLINVPPGHAKSLIVAVFWPAWVWAQKPNHISGGPKWRGLFCSYAEELSIRDSRRCRMLIEDQRYVQAYRMRQTAGEPRLAWTLATDQNVKSWFENSEKGFRIALSVGGKGTGFRGDAIVVDDPLNAKDQYSDTARREVTFWWDNVMSSRLNDLAIGAKVIIQQRLHATDLAGHVLEQGGYEHLNLPSEFEPERRSRTFLIGKTKPFFEDPRQEYRELLFPELFTPDVIEKAKKDLGSTGFAGQHQQRPSAEEGGILKRHWWKYWQPVGAGLSPVLVRKPDGSGHIEVQAIELDIKSIDHQLQSWDCAFKDLETSDYVVGQVQGAKHAQRFVLDQFRDRCDLPTTVKAVRNMSKNWPIARRKLVEDKANGPAVVQTLKDELTGLMEVQPEGGKISRAAAVAPEVEAGNWYLPHPAHAAWVQGFVDECADFPNGKNDDQVDAFTQGGIKWSKLAGDHGLIDYWKQLLGKEQTKMEHALEVTKIQAPQTLAKPLVVVNPTPAANGNGTTNGDAAGAKAPTLGCPSCGSLAIVRIGGFKKCNACGHQFDVPALAVGSATTRGSVLAKFPTARR